MHQMKSETRDGMRVDWDAPIAMDDGVVLRADAFRPVADGQYPVILSYGPYAKGLAFQEGYKSAWTRMTTAYPETAQGSSNKYQNWELVDPEKWVPDGYAIVRVDSRGAGRSPGFLDVWSPREAKDLHDCVEWAGTQPWSNGKVGINGISYYAMNQWFVANLSPPSLKAILPWEGAADLYRDALYHGGLLSVFMTNWFTAHRMHHLRGRASRVEPDRWQPDMMYRWLYDSLDSGALRGAQAQWDKIKVPMFTAGNWSGMALHLRGNTEAFMRAASKHKKLRIHAGSHVHAFYTEEGRADQLRFFDCWLKGIDNGVMGEPPVKLAIRRGRDRIEWRHEHEWPLARTKWTRLYFDLSPPAAGQSENAGGLVSTNPDTMSSRTYAASSLGSMGSTSAASSQVMGGGIKPGMGIALETPPLPQDVEITGPLAAVLWVSSATEDMDLFLTLRNIDADGNEVLETGQQGTPVPVAKGWLRVSHRELDPDLSLPYRPYHKHQRRLYLTQGEIVKVEVEIWPTSMVFRKGHRIRLDVQPRDGVGSASYMHYHADYNTGTNTIYAGGDRESYLLLPFIPAVDSLSAFL
jgi:putative CocE/NonD family hydrolase